MNEYGALVEWYWQEKLKYWEKTLYSVGGRWMNEYGALVEWYWQGKLKYWEKNIIQRRWQMDEWVSSVGGMIWTGETEVLGEKRYTSSVVDEWMSMEHWWNDTDRGNEVVGAEPVLVSHCPIQILHGLTSNRTRAFTFLGRQLITWDMAHRP